MRNCQRCGKPTIAMIMSMFNTEEICMACSDAERKDPGFEDARAADERAVRCGDYNFPGIGRPAWRKQP